MKRALALLITAAVLGGLAFGGNLLLTRWQNQKLTAGNVPTYKVQVESFQRVATAAGYLKAVDSKPITAPRGQRRPRVIAWMAEDGARVAKGDVLLRFDDTDERMRVTSNLADKQKADHSLAKERAAAEAKLGERDLTATVTQEELTRTKELGVKDERFFPRNEVIESQLDEKLYAERLAHSAEAKVLEQKVSARQLDVLAVDRKKAHDQAEEAQRSLDSLEVRATHTGMFVVERMDDRMVRQGDRVWPGMRIAEVSTSDRMEAEVYVLEADAGGLALEKPVELVIESQPDERIKGKIVGVEPFPKPLHPDVPTQYFTARVSLEGEPAGMKPGQSVRARVFLETREDALVVPRQAVFERQGISVVYRRTGAHQFEKVPVTLGPGTVGRLVVETGLSAGDHVALRDPEQAPAEEGAEKGAKDGADREGAMSATPSAAPARPSGRRGRP